MGACQQTSIGFDAAIMFVSSEKLEYFTLLCLFNRRIFRRRRE
jgi:hypothetical protein